MIRGLKTDFAGFTLIEILVVLALISLMALMIPRGLLPLHSKSRHQALVQETLVAAQECAVLARQRQTSLRLGSSHCVLPWTIELGQNRSQFPEFHADGSASHSANIVVKSESGGELRASTIVIDKLTANAWVND